MVLAKEAQLQAKRALPISLNSPLIIPAMALILKKKKKKKNQAMIIEASVANMHQSQKKIESAPYLTRFSSKFSPPKDAVITGVLSKRWAYLWTSIPSLCFTHTYFKSSVDYANAVDNVQLLHRALKLTNFSVQFQFMPDLKPRINLWVRFATTAKVDQVYVYHLGFTNCPSISTPMSLFLSWILDYAKLSLMGQYVGVLSSACVLGTCLCAKMW